MISPLYSSHHTQSCTTKDHRHPIDSFCNTPSLLRFSTSLFPCKSNQLCFSTCPFLEPSANHYSMPRHIDTVNRQTNRQTNKWANRKTERHWSIDCSTWIVLQLQTLTFLHLPITLFHFITMFLYLLLLPRFSNFRSPFSPSHLRCSLLLC